VTCALPYANGPCHIGHLRTYVPADVYVRSLKKLGYKDILFICGSDTHGTPILLEAEKQGIHPRELIEKYHRHFIEVFEKLNIFFDHFGHTDEELNHQMSREIVLKIHEKGYIYPKKLKLPYCPKCKRFLPDRYIVGLCPYCKTEARGDECDQGCGRYLNPWELIDPKCSICGSTPEFKETTHYFFKLSAFHGFLEEYLKKMKGTSIAKNYAIKWLKAGLKDWCITRDLPWGVKFPIDERLVLYVWVDAPIGYITFTKDYCDRKGIDRKEYWKNNAKIIHFIGGDIVYHHCIFWPALLKAADMNLPYSVVASGMVKVEDKVFSKTRGYVIWVEEDYLDKGLDPDCLRYYMISYTRHVKDLNFSWKIYEALVNNELVGTLGNFAYRVLLFTYRNYKEVPEAKLREGVTSLIKGSIDKIIEGLDRYEFNVITTQFMALANYGNKLFQKEQPWTTVKENPEKCKETLYNCLQLLKAIAILMEPVMPIKAEKLWKQLGYDTPVKDVHFEEALKPIEPGRKLGKPKPLFKKVSSEKIQELIKEFEKRVQR